MLQRKVFSQADIYIDPAINLMLSCRSKTAESSSFLHASKKENNVWSK